MHSRHTTSAYCPVPDPEHLILGVTDQLELDLGAIGARIRELRVKAGQSQEGLARAIEANTSDVSRWERGEVAPRAKPLARLAIELKCSVDYILFGDSPSPTPQERAALKEFRATALGKQAEKNGWMPQLRRMNPPPGLELDVYRMVVYRLLDIEQGKRS